MKEALYNGEMVGTVAVDLSKAFDSLPHGLLIAKLIAYDMDIKSCKLISSYLFNRYQRVKDGSSKSEWRQIERGVHQGSILGPLLFNVFITKLLGGILVSLRSSVCLSVRPSRIPWPLCSSYRSGWIHFIFILSSNFRRCVACNVTC